MRKMTVAKGFISIIVPVYNVEKYLRKCIESICSQQYDKLEILLVDDGSTDQSGRICDEYSEKDKRIRVIHKKNGGLSSARNVGIEAATGEFIAFVDSDDYISTGMYRKMIDKMNHDVDMVVCATAMVWDGTKKIQKIGINYAECICDREQTFRYLLQTNLSAWNKLYRREIFNKIRYPLNKVSEDAYIIPYLIMSVNKTCFINYIGYYYRQHSGLSIQRSAYKSKDFDFIMNGERICRFTKKYFPSSMPDAAYRMCIIFDVILNKLEKNNLREIFAYRKDIIYFKKIMDKYYCDIRESRLCNDIRHEVDYFIKSPCLYVIVKHALYDLFKKK